MTGGNVTKQQWQEVEAIVRREQQKMLQQYNMVEYNNLGLILDELYDLAHSSND